MGLIGSLRVSLLVAFVSTVIATAAGTATALALVRSRLRLKRTVEALVLLPVIIPEIVIGFATSAFFGLLGVALGVSTVIAAHIAFSISYVVFVVRARMIGLDPSLEEAAMDLGATRWQAFARVTLPMILPGVLSAALLVFTVSLDDYVITSFVAGPGSTTLPLRIYSMVKTGVTPEVNAISGVLLVVTVLFVIVSERLASGRLSRLSGAGGLAAVLLLLVFAVGAQRRSITGGELNVLIWSNYLPDNVIAEFERRFQARLNIELFESNEAFLARLQAAGESYDIVVPSDYMVTVLRGRGLIRELHLDLLTNFSALDPALIHHPFDSENQYSIPYLWGTAGIGYRKDKIKEPVESWSALWDPRYRDRIAMFDDVREAFAVALRLLGKSINTTDPAEIAQAAALLSEQKPLVKAYDSGAFDQLLLSGDAWIVQGYSGQIAKAMLENPAIGFVIPNEGGTVAIDNLCIPTNAPHPELAHEFINFVLEPNVAARIANETGYSSPNIAARPLIRPEFLQSPVAYPPRELLERCDSIISIGEAIVHYDRYWTQIKSE